MLNGEISAATTQKKELKIIILKLQLFYSFYFLFVMALSSGLAGQVIRQHKYIRDVPKYEMNLIYGRAISKQVLLYVGTL